MQENGKVTMQMIADRLGITKVSVSKALNNQPGVGSDLKKKILDAAREMGYSAQHKPQSGPKRLVFVIGKRFFLETDKFYTVVYYTVAKLCNEHNIRLSLSVIGTSDEAKLALPFSLLDELPDGIFVCGEIGEAYLSVLMEIDVPKVFIDFCKPGMPVDSVVVDNFYAAYCATQHLINQGHQLIGFVGDPGFAGNIMDRYLGYLKALKMSDLPVREDWQIINNDRSGSYDLQYSLPKTLPTAFLCHCDMAAYHLLAKLLSQGVTVPEQVSLISFDNTDLSKSCLPALTTVDIDKVEMATLAFKQILFRIGHMDAAPARIVLNTKLLERNSVVPTGQGSAG